MKLFHFSGASRSFFINTLSLFAIALFSANAADPSLTNLNDRAAYAIGANYGQTLNAQGLKFDTTEIQNGLLDSIGGKPSKYSEQQINAAMDALRKDKESKESTKVAYNVGYSFGDTIKSTGVDLSPQKIVSGIQDGSAGSSKLTAEEIKATLTTFAQEIEKKQQEKMKMAGDKAGAEGEAFLAKNKSAEGVKTLPSGLQYKVITDGKGKSPAASSFVTTHYRGTLIDGTEFDSSYKRNQPATFPVNGVIAGWTEALQLMKEGSKWQLFIPAKLAYGLRGAPPVIPPNATLIFEVELLKVQ